MKVTSRRRVLKYGAATCATLAAGAYGGPPGHAALSSEVLNIGVVFAGPVAAVGWVKQHSLAVDGIRAAFGDRARITAVENVVNVTHAEQVFRDLAANGNRLIFGTSFVHGLPMQIVAPYFPAVAFEHCTGLVTLENLGTFDARYYEGGYVAGVAAGHMTQSGKIGFIANYPIADCISTANAFLLAARAARPGTTCEAVFLNSWYDPAAERQAASALISRGCDVICPMTDSAAAVEAAGERGAWSIGYASDMSGFAARRQLTAFMLDWSSEYVRAAEAVAAGTWAPEQRWDGLAAEVIRMAGYHSALSSAVHRKLRQTEADVGSGALHPFAGELWDRDGNLRVAAGDVATALEIRTMDWFVSGMITGGM